MREPENGESYEPPEWVVADDGCVVCPRLGIRVVPTVDVGVHRHPRNPADLCAALNRVYAVRGGGER